MAKTIVFTSGKGGVGKTTIALNLGLLLAKQGRRVTVVDADLRMANLGILMGIDSSPITLHNVLAGENVVADAVYQGPNGMKYVPAGLSMDHLEKIDYSKLADAVKTLAEQNDFILVDSPPGLGKDAEAAMRGAEEAAIVMTPEPASLADALKAKIMAERAGTKIIGVVLNMSYGDKTEIRPEDLATVMEVPVLAVLPDDREVRRSTALQQPVVIRTPAAPFSKALEGLAHKIAGEQAPSAPPKARKGLLDSIISLFRGLFGKR